MASNRMNGADRRKAIISTARLLFAEHGYNGTSVRAIAKAVGVSEGLLYKYFPSKESLYQEIMGYAVNLAAIFFDTEKLKNLKPGAESLVKYAYTVIRLILFEAPGLKEAQYWHERLLFRSLVGDNRYALANFKNLQEHIAVYIPAHIEAAIRDGEMMAVDIPPYNCYWLLHHLAMALNLCFLNDEPSFRYGGSKEELARQALSFSLRGMGMTPEAIARYYQPEKLEEFFYRLYK